MATLKQKVQLLRGLIDGEIAHSGPFYVQVNPTNLCNLQCQGCRYQSSKTRGLSPTVGDMRHMPLKLVEQLCEELPAVGTREATICGEGESLLYPHWFEMVSAFKRAGLFVQLFTNGTLLDESTASLLLDSGLDVLNVSMWATSPEEYTKCYPGTDSVNFGKALDGVDAVTKLKAERQTSQPTVILTGPLNRHNYKSIRRRIALADERGCNGVRFAPFVDIGGEFASDDVPPGEIDTLCEELSDSKTVIESLSLSHNLDEALLRFTLGGEVWHQVPCYACWFYAHISFDGQVRPCGTCLTPLGNLNDSSFEDIWNGQEYRAFRVNGLTTSGLASLQQRCDCSWCCHSTDSYSVQRIFRWIAPLLGRTA
jgi:MoaA/NifB/PqqE/SkfB family radical SAM enzyme